MFLFDRLCGGHGRCECNQCICDEDWVGSDCSCSTGLNNCMAKNQQVCNGRGSCECGTCICTHPHYSGPTCEIKKGSVSSAKAPPKNHGLLFVLFSQFLHSKSLSWWTEMLCTSPPGVRNSVPTSRSPWWTPKRNWQEETVLCSTMITGAREDETRSNNVTISRHKECSSYWSKCSSSALRAVILVFILHIIWIRSRTAIKKEK